MSKKQISEEKMAEMIAEAERWNPKTPPIGEFVDAPEAVPRHRETEMISLRMPVKLLEIVKEIARRNGVGYQVQLKRWMDEKVREYSEQAKATARVPAGPLELGQLSAEVAVVSKPTAFSYPLGSSTVGHLGLGCVCPDPDVRRL